MTTQSYSELQAQIEKLRKEAEALRQQEVAGVVERIKEAIALYELTSEDLFGKQGRGAGPRSTAKGAASSDAKYRDGDGRVWSGRGPRPRWLREALAQGKALEDFRV